MNTQGIKISEEIKALVKTVHKRDWEAMFTSLKAQELESITSTDDADLPKLKARATVIDELKTFFTQQIAELKLES